MPRFFLILCLIFAAAESFGASPSPLQQKKRAGFASSQARPTTAPADLTAPEEPAKNEESLDETMWRDFISPVTTSAWIPLAAGATLTLAVYDLRGTIDNPLQANWSNRKPLGASSHLGDFLGQIFPNAAYIAGMYADYWWGSRSKKSRVRAIMMFKATSYAGAWALAIKYSVHERRPNGTDRRSFPSGHSATAFAFASLVGAEHEWYWGVPAYAMAVFVGASRINDNMHRLHDVIAGTTLGLSYGLGIYYRTHERDSKPLTTVYQVLPTDRMDGATLTMTHEF